MSNPRHCLRFKLPLAWEKGENTATVSDCSCYQHREVGINLTDISGAAHLGAGISSEVFKDVLTSWAKWAYDPGASQFQGTGGYFTPWNATQRAGSVIANLISIIGVITSIVT